MGGIMAVIKIKRPNGEEHTFNLTENAQDTGGNYIRVRFNGQDLYARVSGDWTPLNVVKPNGDRGYVQYDPITFNTWKWEARNVESFNRWYVYLPKGRYNVMTEGQEKKNNTLTITNSKTVEITLNIIKRFDSGDTLKDFLNFNIDNQIVTTQLASTKTNRIIIERTGDL